MSEFEFDTAPNPDSVEARLARAEQAVDLLLRALHGHFEMHLDLDRDSSFDAQEVVQEWNEAMTERFGDLPNFETVEQS